MTRNEATLEAVRGAITNEILHYDVRVEGETVGQIKRDGSAWKWQTSHDRYGWSWQSATSRGDALDQIMAEVLR